MDRTASSTLETRSILVSNLLEGESQAELITEIYQGLLKDQKQISSRFFYDGTGSALFESITALPEYYPTRKEKQILHAHAGAITGEFEHLDIVELGSGDCSKISILLDSLPGHKMEDVHYMPVDVSGEAIAKSTGQLTMKYPDLEIHGFLADFLKHMDALPGSSPRLICFFGSTLGNLTRQQAIRFLKEIGGLMKPGDRLLLGLDMVKDPVLLHNAYNDEQGITARFNKNILRVINRIAGTDFDTRNFEHHAFYNEKDARIEMHLEALRPVTVKSDFFGGDIHILEGETIHTEYSHKYKISDLVEFESHTNLHIEKIYKDENEWFTLTSYKKK